MKKILRLVIATVLVFAMTACGNGGEYTVANEKDALAVYTCPSDNMFGLEKVVIFEDKVVTVFNKAINDESGHGTCKSAISSGYPYRTGASLSNVRKSKTTDTRIEEKNGKYISTIEFEYDPADKIDPNEDVNVRSYEVFDQGIAITDKCITLTYIEWGGECSNDYDQKYDFSTNSWSEIQEQLTLYPMTGE